MSTEAGRSVTDRPALSADQREAIARRKNPYRLSPNMLELLADCARTDPEPMYVQSGKWWRTADALLERGLVTMQGFQPWAVTITPLGREVALEATP